MKRMIISALGLLLSGSVLAYKNVDEILERVVKGYGGKAFTNLEKVKFRDKHFRFVTGQSYSSKAE